MGLSRSMDIRGKQALPVDFISAPEKMRIKLGNCIECGNPISTHAYELMLETSSIEKPSFIDKQYDSVSVCEVCYHKFSEKGFWLKTIVELAWILNVIGVIMALVGFLLIKSTSVGAIGVFLVFIPSLARVPARKAGEHQNEKIISKYFPKSVKAKHLTIPFPWWTNSVFISVPSALAFVVHSSSTIQQLSIGDLKAILGGKAITWSDFGGPDKKINLYLPIGLWREWSLVKKSILKNEEPGKYILLKHPLEILDKLQEDENGIGFVSLTSLSLYGDCVRALSVDDQECTAENHKYPLWIIPKLFPVTDQPT